MKKENKINLKQNEECSIQMLAAQREVYEEAKRYEKLVVIFSILLPVISAIMNDFFKDNVTLTVVTYIVSVVSLFIGLFFRRKINKEKSLAANIQLQFDMYVYQLPWDKDLFGERKDLNDTIAEKASKHLTNKERRNKLVDWYRPEVAKYDYLNSIAFSQKENLSWDSRLRRRYKWGSIILIVIISVIILGSGIAIQDSLEGILLKLIFIAPLVCWLWDTILSLNDDIDRLKHLKSKLDEQLTIKRLKVIQKDITEHRKNCRSIPRWFYNRFREKDEIIQKNVDIVNQSNVDD